MDESFPLRIKNLSHAYGAVPVLKGIDLEVRAGEIHALLGENGAGKSTLIKILAGVLNRAGGEVLVDGEDVDQASRPRIAFVHQDLALVESLSVADNVALQVGFEKRRGVIAPEATNRRVNELLELMGASFDAARLVSSLSQDERVLCALARAFGQDATVIVLDEVSASLPAPEMERLSASLRRARENGVTFLFVTHRLAEVFSLADRVTVLRDGKVALCADVADVTHDEVVEAILGAAHVAETRVRARSETTAGAPALQVRDLCGPGLEEPLSFDVAAGEVLGICGLVGSGTRELARLLGGREKPTSGYATRQNVPIRLGDTTAMARQGIAFVPGNRREEGLFPDLLVRENLFPTIYQGGGWSRRGVRKPAKERQAADAVVAAFRVQPPEPERVVTSLSGGNQQKVVFARALSHDPRIVILEDPTAGVDIGSRAALHALMRQAAEAGTSVVVLSTDFDEVATQCDRILVMRNKRLEAEFHADDIPTADSLARACYGTIGDDAVKGKNNV